MIMYNHSLLKFTGLVSFIFFLIGVHPWTPYGWNAGYPERPITIVVPYAPGGVDLEARVVAPALGKILGQSVLIENRAGGGGSVGTYYVVQSKPDGYTLLYTGTQVLNLAPFLTDLPYKMDDLIPLAGVSYCGQMFAVSPDNPWKTIYDLIDHAKKNPGAIRYGTAGTASLGHISSEALALAAKIQMTHVPFKGIGEAIPAVMGGHIECVNAIPQSILPQAKAGKLRPLVIFASIRHQDFPDTPAISEIKIPYEVRAGVTRDGFYVPKGTPQLIFTKLAEAIRKMLSDPENLNNFKKIGTVPEFSDHKEFKTFLEEQALVFNEMIVKIGLKKK